MFNSQRDIKQKLVNLSKEQAPDAWPKLRDRVLAGKLPGTASQTPGIPEKIATYQRSEVTMKRKYVWLTVLSSAVIILFIAGVIVSQLLPDSQITRLEPGKSIKYSDGTIFINQISRTDPKIGMPPDADFQDLTLADLTTIFGRAPILGLPDGFRPDSETFSAMIFRNGTVFLMNGLSFSADSNDPAAARIVFDLNDQGELPLSDCRFGNEQASTLGGVDMMIGVENIKGDEGTVEVYTAQFVANGIGYRIRASNMTGEVFLSILKAVVKG
jgi:hypothetical protein